MTELKKALELYLVTDDGQLKGRDFFETVEDAIRGGVSMVQLREKNCSSKYFFEKAKKLKQLTQRYRIPLVINDRVDIALAVKAEGIHVGQSDIPVCEVKKIIGSSMFIGATANTKELAKKAELDGADYLGVGALFQTSTKLDAKPLSSSELSAITSYVSIPVVAIGGISLKNAHLLSGTNIAGVAVSSGIMGCEDVLEAAKKLKEIKL